MTTKPKREYTELQLAFLEALGGEAKGDLNKAKQIAGYAPSVRVKTIVDSLKDEILELANDLLVSNAPKAALNMIGVLDTPDALGARNKINAAAAILDRVGIIKKEVVEHKVGGASIFILPPKDA